MIISIVVAADEKNGIGLNNKLPWRLSSDLKYFKQITTGHHIIMGRNTFESIGKALPDRTNIVLSSQTEFKPKDVIVCSGIQDALNHAHNAGERECMIIGGAALYRQMITFTDRIYLTRVHAICKCDVFFPEINPEEWKCISTEIHKADDKNEYDYSFEIFERTTLST
jgi:dihydrofolate reductase